MEHLREKAEDATDVISVYPLLTDDTCRFIVFDFDNHEKGAERNGFANADDLWRDEADSLRRKWLNKWRTSHIFTEKVCF